MLKSKFDRYLDSFYTQKNVPGLGCIVRQQGQTVYEHYAGYADVENRIPFDGQTIFNLYSATKVITVTAAMQLVEKGKMRLSDPLYEYLPEYRHMMVQEGETIRPVQQPITIQHLFTMSSGIRGGRTPEVQKVVAETDGRAPTREVVRAWAQQPLQFEPGTRFQYGISHDVLGAVIEVVSGQKLSQYCKEHIFDPLGMVNTTYHLTPEQEKRMAKLYNQFNGQTESWNSIGETMDFIYGSEYEAAGGGLKSTVQDYIRFADALCQFGKACNGEQILTPASVNELRRNRLEGQALQDFWNMGGWSKAGYGYGLGVRTLLDRERNHSLSENGEFGWDGARGCYVVIDPDAGITLFYAQQEAGTRWYEYHGTIRNYAYAICD